MEMWRELPALNSKIFKNSPNSHYLPQDIVFILLARADVHLESLLLGLPHCAGFYPTD